MHYQAKSTTLLIIAVPVTLLFLVGVGMFLFRPKLVKTEPLPQNSLPASPEVINPKMIPSAGIETYTNDLLKFSFSYPKEETLVPCADVPCATLTQSTVGVQPLYVSDVTIKNAQADLRKSDLLCSADGPNGSISCKNESVEKFTTLAGINGYKITRLKTFAGKTDVPAGSYPDIVYAFTFPEVKNVGGNQYSGVMFFVENPTADNLGTLWKVADSYTLQ